MIRLLLLLYDPLSYSTLARRETGENDEQSVVDKKKRKKKKTKKKKEDFLEKGNRVCFQRVDGGPTHISKSCCEWPIFTHGGRLDRILFFLFCFH